MSELKLQQQIYIWFYNNYPEYRIPNPSGGLKQPRCLLFHNLLNAKSKVEGAKLAGCGLTKGVPDLFLAIPSGPCSGLYLELKIGNEKPKKYQLEVMESLKNQGFAVGWTNNFEEAKEMIENYLNLEE